MLNRITVFATIFLLVICCQALPTNAVECIDMNVHGNEVINCCKHEPFSDKETNEKCSGELSSQVSTSSKDFTVCFIDCAYRRMGFLTEDGKVDVEKYVKFLDWFDTGYQMSAGNAFKQCATLQEDIRRDVATIQLRCNAFALLFHVCVTQLVMQSCPVNRWLKGEICDKVKMGVPACN